MHRSFFFHLLAKNQSKKRKVKKDVRKSSHLAFGQLKKIIFTSNSFLTMNKCSKMRNKGKRIAFFSKCQSLSRLEIQHNAKAIIKKRCCHQKETFKS